VAKATLVRPGLLPSIRLGPEPAHVSYISGELGWNNPSKEVIREFEVEWKHEGILCFTSIGTGHQGTIQVKSLNTPAEKMATDCQRVAEEIAYRFQKQNNYFRLNVEQGFQHTNGQQMLRLGDVMVHTKAYLDSNWADILVDQLVDALLRADEAVPWQTTRENFEKTMTTYLTNTQSYVDYSNIDEVKQGLLKAAGILELIRVRLLSGVRS
jgi:hypothetical protein